MSRGALAAALCIPRLPGPPQRMCPTLVWGRRGAVCASLACRGRRGACVQRMSGAAAALCAHPSHARAAAAHVSNACLGPPRRCVRIPRLPGPPQRMCPTLAGAAAALCAHPSPVGAAAASYRRCCRYRSMRLILILGFPTSSAVSSAKSSVGLIPPLHSNAFPSRLKTMTRTSPL